MNIARNRVVAVALLLLFPSTALAQIASPFSPERLDHAIAVSSVTIQAACDTSRATGRNDADERHGTAGWFLGSLGAGLAATFIGMGAVTAGAAFTNPQPRELPTGIDEQCYRDGYKSKAKNKNVVSSLLGGLIGSLVWIGIYSAAVND